MSFVEGSWRFLPPIPSPSPSKRRPLPVPPSPSGSASASASAPTTLLDEEPTMEVLLAELGARPPAVTGARAWEEVDLANGLTIKRVPAHAHTHDLTMSTIGQKTIQGLGSGRSTRGSSNGKGGERRVVTAIFAPYASAAVEVEPPEAPVPLKPLDVASIAGLTALAEKEGTGVSMPTRPPDEPPSTSLSPSKSASRPLPEPPVSAPGSEPSGPGASASAEQDRKAREAEEAERLAFERMLEDEVLATRALVDTFRVRLEIVEQKVAELEVHEALRAAAELARQQAQEREQAQASVPEEAQPQPQSQPQPHPRDQDQEEPAAGASTSGARAESVEISVQAEFAQPESVSSAASVSAGAVPLLSVAVARRCGPERERRRRPTTPTTIAPIDSKRTRTRSRATGHRGAPAPGSTPDHAGRGRLRLDHRLGEGEGEREEGDELPSHLSNLPSYVLLTGLGVCAVVTQVVVQRVFGRGLWRP